MEWLIIFIVVVIGLTLLVLEFLVLPGVGVAGMLGLGCVCFGVYLGYKLFGATTGHYILAGILLLSLGTTIYAIRAKTWKRLGLHASIDSTVEGVDRSIKTGDIGVTIGRLAPMGKVKVGDNIIEAQSMDGYVDSNTDVEVIKVFKDKIIVKLK